MHSFDQVDKFAPCEVADIQIDLLSIGMRFTPRKQLCLVISDRNLVGPMLPMVSKYVPANQGHTSSTPEARAPLIFNSP